MKELTCIGCPKGCHLLVDEENDYKVTGNSCSIGAEYGRNELLNPTRILTSTVKITGGIHEMLPVRSDKAIAKDKLFEVMESLKRVRVTSPIKMGDVIIENVLDTGANIIASRDM